MAKRRMKKRKKQILAFVWIAIAVLAVSVAVYGGYHDWFKFSINFNLPKEEALTPNSQNAVYSSCSQVCSAQSFSESYSLIDSCKAGESKVTYGYPGQNPLLVCCCYNKPAGPTCTDTDGGENKDVPGTVTYNGANRYMDSCFDSTTVYEYRCNADNTWQGGKISCDAGQTCLSSRSGGYCKAKTWNIGDTVTEGNGAGTLVGDTIQVSSIDLSDYGINTGGNCQLGAQIQTSWNYANPNDCAGIPGTVGVKWDFYDSAGLEYSRLDPTPVALGVDLHPTQHYLDWDGHTNWRGLVSKVPNIFPQCIINYQYNVRIYIYSC